MTLNIHNIEDKKDDNILDKFESWALPIFASLVCGPPTIILMSLLLLVLSGRNVPSKL